MSTGSAMRVCAHRRRSCGEEEGAVALEFALILPFLVALLLGVTTLGVAYSNHLALTNAVREGARLGGVLAYDPANPTAWADSVALRTQETFFNTGDLPLSQICVKLTSSDGSTTIAQTNSVAAGTCGAAPSSPPPAATTGTCLVWVWARRQETVILGVFPNLAPKIYGQSVGFYGRVVGSCTAP